MTRLALTLAAALAVAALSAGTAQAADQPTYRVTVKTETGETLVFLVPADRAADATWSIRQSGWIGPKSWVHDVRPAP